MTEKLIHLFRRKRLSEIEALDDIAACACEIIELSLVLNALGNGLKAHCMRHIENGFGDYPGGCIIKDRIYEALINLKGIDGELLKV